MATIFPPFRSLAPRTALQWNYNNVPLGGAVIDGFDANFAGIVGGETVTISVAGGPATVITMIAGDVTDVLVRDRINATFPGLASVNAAGGIRLLNATSVAITAISGADQAKIGLPAALSRSAVAGLTTLGRPDLVQLADRIDLVSQPIALPDGANRLAVWLRVKGLDATEVGCEVRFGFSNGTDGEIASLTIDQANAMQLMEYSRSPDGLQRTLQPVFEAYYAKTLGQNLGFMVPLELEIPPGATKFYLTLGPAEDPRSSTTAYVPPEVTGGVIPGVR